MKYRCNRCGFSVETEGSPILNFDAHCRKCLEIEHIYGRRSQMIPIEENEDDKK